MGLAVGLLYWLARLPELALLAAPALAVIVVWGEVPGADPMSQAANVAVVAALAFGWAAARERLAARSRQRRIVEQATGVRHRLPGPVGPLTRGRLPLAAALVLCAVAIGAVLAGLDGIRADEDHAARAVRTTAKVISRGEESVLVRTDGERRISVAAFYPEDYREGSTVTVLEDGSWRRLEAEPYDAFGWQLLVLTAGLCGLSLLTAGALARHRTAALRRVPVPALRVLERTGQEGRVWIYAADDTSGRNPLFSSFFTATAPDSADEAMGRRAEDDDDGDEEAPVIDTRLHEAVMLGAPCDGGELVLVTTDWVGQPVRVRTAAPIRRARTGKQPALPATATADTDTARLQRQAREEVVAATLTPTDGPLSWGPGTVARTAGLALTVGVTAGISYATHSFATDGFAWGLIPLLGLSIWLNLAAVLLNWRVTADSTGLWLTGAWTVRHILWEQLKTAQYTEEGSVKIRRSDGDTWYLTGLGEPRLERRFKLRPSYVRMTEEVTALHNHPHLRPTETSTLREHGLPLGPVLLLLIALVTMVVFVM
ncbi:hypothetical protein [Streptomyces flaveolus]|uniref:hypothetical protein n=1 Tax=Streptomyces flaveolus TaxID=67297 RepID=UPI003700253E